MPAAPKRKIDSARLPEWARRITALRGKRTKAAFAGLLDVSTMSVSNWENGVKRPGSMTYLKLAKLADGEAAAWFAAHGGSKETDLAFEVLGRETPASVRRLVSIPLIAATAGAGPGRLHDWEDIEGEVAVPRDLCRAPNDTACIRVRGTSMQPTIQDGTIAAVDQSQTNLDALLEEIVAACHPDEGLVVKRLAFVKGEHRLLSDERGNTELRLADGWEVLGKVIWWVQRAEGR